MDVVPNTLRLAKRAMHSNTGGLDIWNPRAPLLSSRAGGNRSLEEKEVVVLVVVVVVEEEEE